MINRPLEGAYIARLDLSRPHLAGVAEKVRAQVAVLSDGLGASVDLLCPSGGDIAMNGQIARHFGSGIMWRRLVHYFLFYMAVPKLLGQPDFIYLRYQGSSPMLLWMLHRLRRGNPDIPILVEVPTFPYDQKEKTLRRQLTSAVERSARKLLRRYVTRIVTFSRQEQIFGINTIRIDNGVDVQRLKVSAAPKSENKLRLLGLANLSTWHGYDRVIEGIALHNRANGSRGVYFDVVGTGNELENLKDIARRQGVEANVIFHGSIRGDPLDRIVDTCHIGIGCIGMHRVCTDTSDLKSREFCARGLPFVTGYDDKDFGSDFEFAKRVPSCDSPLDIASVIEFYESLDASRCDFRTQMRCHAEKNLGWEIKLAPVLEFIKQHCHAR